MEGAVAAGRHARLELAVGQQEADAGPCQGLLLLIEHLPLHAVRRRRGLRREGHEGEEPEEA